MTRNLVLWAGSTNLSLPRVYLVEFFFFALLPSSWYWCLLGLLFAVVVLVAAAAAAVLLLPCGSRGCLALASPQETGRGGLAVR